MENTNPAAPAGAAPAAPAPAPAAPAAPVANPTPAVVPATPEMGQAPVAPKKKSKVGLIVTLIIIFLLLAGAAVAAIIFYNIHESAENAISDGFTKLLTADQQKISGTLTSKSDGNTVKLEYTVTEKDGAFSGTGKINVEADGTTIKAGVDVAADSDGNVYFRLADKGNIEDVLGGLIGGLSYSMDSDVADLISNVLGTAIDELDGNWYKIPADMKIGSSKNPMSCVVEKSKNLKSEETAKAVKEAFKEHPFMKAKDGAEVKSKDGYKLYTIEVDNDEYKEFSKALEKIDAYKELSECASSSSVKSTSLYEEYLDEDYDYDFDDEDDDIVVSPEKEKEFKGDIQLGITGWTHELKYVNLTSKEDDTETSIEANIEYSVDKVEIPSDAKEIKELVKTLKASVVSYYVKAMSAQYCTESMQYMGKGSKEACESYVKDAVEEQFGGDDEDVDIEDLIETFSVQNTGGSEATSLMGHLGGIR